MGCYLTYAELLRAHIYVTPYIENDRVSEVALLQENESFLSL